MRIAFYAPIKPPDHPIPSGDRLIAGNLLKVLKLAGHEAHLASRYIAYSKRSDGDILAARKKGALEEASRLIEKYLAMNDDDRPQIWMTYHPYCKAPDWIGPRVSKSLSIPYITIEACKTGQGDQWLPWRAEAQIGIRQADRHIWFKPTDRKYLIELLGSDEKLCHLPPFIDLSGRSNVPPATLPEHWKAETPTLITVGMMRKGKKDKNFYLLAEILEDMQEVPWNMVIIGGGPEEAAIRQAFSSIDKERLHWTGEVSSNAVAAWMKASDIFTWPGWREPIGMVYLEAAAEGLPTVAFDNMGVPLVVLHGKTGLLAPLDDLEVFRRNLTVLLNDRDQISKMGVTAREFVSTARSLPSVTTQFNNCLEGLGTD